MQRWTKLAHLPDGVSASVVSIGNFDGVHKGHQAVLRAGRRAADEAGLRFVVVTFDPHPLAVLAPEKAPAQLTTMDERCHLLATFGVDAVLVLPFTQDVASWSPEDFVDKVIVSALLAKHVVVGEDFRFGARGAGTVETLKQCGSVRDFTVDAVADVAGKAELLEGGRCEKRWSSSWARELITAGEVGAARDVLRRPHRVSGEVVHGDHRGRELGYPTANLETTGLVPADGIYAGWLVAHELPTDHPDHRMPAAISIGTNPTFDGKERRVEAYVIDRTDLDLYGQQVSLDFVARIRETIAFDGIEPLLEQMAHDVQQCREIIAQA